MNKSILWQHTKLRFLVLTTQAAVAKQRDCNDQYSRFPRVSSVINKRQSEHLSQSWPVLL